MNRLVVLFLAVFLVSCASTRPPLPPPGSSKPPTIDTGSLGANITNIEKSLKKAASRVDRIEILIDSLPETP
jgi:hypothetical protein